MKRKLLSGNRLHILLHVLAWIFLFFLPQYLMMLAWGRSGMMSGRLYFNTAVYAAVFYINYIWLIPRFFLKDRKWMYFLLISVMVFALYWVSDWGNHLLVTADEQRFMEAMREIWKKNNFPKPPPREFHIYIYLVTSILVSGFAMGLRVMGKLAKNEAERKDLEKAKLNSELALLKSQISPHFFFNTMNNIYSLISLNQNDAGEAVLKLSHMMRYLLYESESELIPLEREISFMRNYFDLMKLRINEKVTVNVSFPEETQNIKVSPLLFIPFIENAFKHGISYREKSFIDIVLQVDDGKINFMCRNSKVSSGKPVEKHSGIGLENARKRLKLLYPGKHKLEIHENDEMFQVLLTIQISES
ncbi:sensor histidine kinase [Prolixibacter denitrificans]|uniref:Histidine kinase n=1 Tax=Prolixibacter denitrificans TaxID=1541063 RepID=A0A2P8C6Z2_9BACT|nr:histidine kinase [Prolixibacter denitrificans]PSK80721.1 histidine kinase [Prolixibacter denitrificans]GET22479.1 histidine kinase [Prolixibacter denitrificans]